MTTAATIGDRAPSPPRGPGGPGAPSPPPERTGGQDPTGAAALTASPGGQPRPGRVVVVGSVNVDILVTAEALPGPGETVTGGTRADHPGGKGANQAVAAARAGAPTILVGAVGADREGRWSRAQLGEEGVDTTWLATVPGSRTGTALVVVDRHGENQIAVASGANAELAPEGARRALGDLALGPGDVCLTGFEVPEALVEAAAAACAATGAHLLVNTAPARPLGPATRTAGAVVVANAAEARALMGVADPGAAAEALRSATGSPAVVTLGAGGALLVDGRGRHRWRPPPGAVVDTTGAGDTFCGVLAAGLAQGLALQAATRRAVAASALSARVGGARAGMPTRAAIDSAAPGAIPDEAAPEG